MLSIPSSGPKPFARTIGLAVLVALVATPRAGAEGEPATVTADASVAAETPAASSEPAAAAAVPASTTPARQPIVFDELSVVGGSAGVADVPGSAHVIGKLELAEQKQSDIHRVLARVPGVVFQEEEGYGLRPNIGMRGTGTERSQKITLLEDGVLIAPAPYAAPSAYYFPTTGRMESVEVRKGSSSIRQGPYTNGGVLNLLSTSIPAERGGQVEVAVGEDATRRGHAFAGDSGERWGWLVETYQLSTDGFKQLDGGGPSGFELADYTAKLRWTSDAASDTFHAVELKLGTTEQHGDETYLGLTQADFDAAPNRRYVASAEDRIDTDHDQVQLSWLVQPSERLDLTTTVYRNDFFRNWYKLQSVAGQSLSDVLDNPDDFAGELAILRGEADSDADALQVRANRRDYYAEGVQSVLALRPRRGSTGRARHELEVGVRLHRDAEDRFQEDDGFAIVDGAMRRTSTGAPGSQANRISSAEAVALFVADRVEIGRWSFAPGIRFESIDFVRRDFGHSDPRRTGAELSRRDNGVDVWIPGLGVGYRASDTVRLFAGVHKGFAPPGPGATSETRAEESVNYELGLRTTGRPLDAEVVVFYNDYDNLLGADTLSSGGAGTGDLFNGGSVEVRGLEAALSYDAARLGRRPSARFSLPLRLSYTWTDAEFRSSFESDFADWAPRVEAGDQLPYLPEHQVTASLGLVLDRWSTYLSATWTDAMRTRPGQGAIRLGESTDEHFLVDLTAGYELRSGLSAFVQVRNLTDETYVVARRPAGARPGLPRTALAGLTLTF